METNLSDPSNALKKAYPYKINNTRTTFVTYSFSLFAILNTALLAVVIYIIIMLDKILVEPTNDEAIMTLRSLGHRYDTLLDCWELVYFICWIIFLFWLYRASNNAHSLSQNKLKFTPLWCVLSYLIPIVNLFWPYQSMKEIFVTTSNKGRYIIAVWWFTFLIMHITFHVDAHLPKDTLANIHTFLIICVAAHVCSIISALSAIIIAREINHSQTGAH